jgi:hypothetical protein
MGLAIFGLALLVALIALCWKKEHVPSRVELG